jgi:hypothetical protein
LVAVSGTARDLSGHTAVNSKRDVPKFAWYSTGYAIFHLTVKMLYHVRYGQSLPGLIVDYIAISLLPLGSWLRLVRGWNASVLCGAWGFEFCLTYRSFFWRVKEIVAGTAGVITKNTAYGLGVLLLVSAASFGYSIWLCRLATNSD